MNFRDWPANLIAFKWAGTLSEAEQAELLASSLRRLQNAIDAARSALAQETLRCIESQRVAARQMVNKSKSMDSYRLEECEARLAELNCAGATLRELFVKEGIDVD